MEMKNYVEKYVKYEKYRRALELPKEQTPTEVYDFIGQGEYNANYKFTHPITHEELVLRINTGSQMGLANQIEYEANALSVLERSGRTPKVKYVDDEKKCIDKGVLVMTYLTGHHLDYDKEYLCAASILADIHSVKLENDERCKRFLEPELPLNAILKESEDMYKVYSDSMLSNIRVSKKIRSLFDMAYDIVRKSDSHKFTKCIVNTELNNTNFLINEADINSKNNYLIDWEKPIISDPAQDLGHFLAPTTTFWKTDKIFSEKEIETFIDEYEKSIDKRIELYDIRDRAKEYMLITCMRGITWCAMAYNNYLTNEVGLRNESTFRKLGQYLSYDFLDKIEGYLV